MTEARRGFALGVLGVVIFAMTLPMTRLAVGDASDPQLPPAFVTAGRAAVAGLLSALYLLAVRAPPPARRHWPALTVSALGTVVGFPLFLALALRQVDAMHAAVVTGVMPLGTAVVAALALRQRPSAGFWACAVLGCALVLGFAAWQGSGRLAPADGLLLLAVLGFFAWYRGLALGGVVRVSQTQLLQPFLALLFAVPVLGEKLEPLTVLFSLAVIAVVFLGRRMPVHRSAA